MRINLLTAVLTLVYGSIAFAQSWTPPLPEQRCPSKWGASDERGAANQVTGASVLRAAQLIRTGEMIELGHVLTGAIPLFGTRTFDLITKRTNGPLGTNKRFSNEELVVTELGQVGTQFDMFSHQGIDGQFYNCVPIESVATRSGFQKLGVEKIGTLFARGVLTSVEVSPNPDKNLDLPVHQIALVVNGIFLLENLKLDELAAKHVHEFALIVEPLKISGGTGSTVAPVAVH